MLLFFRVVKFLWLNETLKNGTSNNVNLSLALVPRPSLGPFGSEEEDKRGVGVVAPHLRTASEGPGTLGVGPGSGEDCGTVKLVESRRCTQKLSQGF